MHFQLNKINKKLFLYKTTEIFCTVIYQKTILTKLNDW